MSQWVKTLATELELDPQDPQSGREQTLSSYPWTAVSTKACTTPLLDNEMH